MLPNGREARLRCFRNALGNWKYDGYVRFKPLAEDWLARELPGMDLRQIAGELHQYVEMGGKIDEQKEERPEYTSFEFHYDLRLQIGDRHVYFETVLKVFKNPDDPDDPIILVVNVHDVS